MLAAITEAGIASSEIQSVFETAESRSRGLRSEVDGKAVSELIYRVELRSDGLCLLLKLPITPTETIDGKSIASLPVTRFLLMQTKGRGVETRIILEGSSD